MNIEAFTFYLQKEYKARLLSSEEAEVWLNDDEILVAGYSFDNRRELYRLIALREYNNFTSSEKAELLNTFVSPHSHMKAIVYTDSSGENNIKIINGMAGILLDLFRLYRTLSDDEAIS